MLRFVGDVIEGLFLAIFLAVLFPFMSFEVRARTLQRLGEILEGFVILAHRLNALADRLEKKAKESRSPK